MNLAKVKCEYAETEGFILLCLLHEIDIVTTIYKEAIIGQGQYYFYVVCEENKVRIINNDYTVIKLIKI